MSENDYRAALKALFEQEDWKPQAVIDGQRVGIDVDTADAGKLRLAALTFAFGRRVPCGQDVTELHNAAIAQLREQDAPPGSNVFYHCPKCGHELLAGV